MQQALYPVGRDAFIFNSGRFFEAARVFRRPTGQAACRCTATLEIMVDRMAGRRNQMSFTARTVGWPARSGR
jgi:hypothetical protein